MANYNSNYTGAEIDAGIAKAQTSAQLNTENTFTGTNTFNSGGSNTATVQDNLIQVTDGTHTTSVSPSMLKVADGTDTVKYEADNIEYNGKSLMFPVLTASDNIAVESKTAQLASANTFTARNTFQNDVTFTDAIYDQNNSTGNAGQVLTSNGTGVVWTTPVTFSLSGTTLTITNNN